MSTLNLNQNNKTCIETPGYVRLDAVNSGGVPALERGPGGSGVYLPWRGAPVCLGVYLPWRGAPVCLGVYLPWRGAQGRRYPDTLLSL